jgi:two-component system chemotaxis sensor kinase CheA
MADDDERFLKRLLETFEIEAQEHLDTMSSLLLQLERGLPRAESAQAVETLFREAHSLKGAARSVNLADIERLCQAVERVLSAWKGGTLAVSPAVFDRMHAALDGLAGLLAQPAAVPAAGGNALAARLSGDLLGLLAPAAAASTRAMAFTHAGAPTAPVPAGPGTAPPAADTVRIATAKLDALMTQVEELQALKFGSAHVADELRSSSEALAGWRRQWDRRWRQARVLRRAGIVEASTATPRNRRLLARLLEGFDAEELALKSLLDRVARLDRAAQQERRGASARVDRLLDDMRQVLMLPLSTLLAPLPRLARDLARDGGKEADLVVRGATLDVDRRILEQMKAPLIHLVRNAVDHGIELPTQRMRAGKPPRGRITIDVLPREGNRIEIVVGDDGAGLALDKLRSRAERLQRMAPGTLDAMNAAQVADLVFESGLSTAALLTELSGHGVGLAIVREKVEALGGSVAVQPPVAGEPGTRLLIVLPTTLAAFRGLLVHAGGRPFVLPSRHVERVARVPLSALEHGGSLALDGESMHCMSLSDVLELPLARRTPAQRFQQLVVLASGDRRVAFAVDEVLGDEEVLVKPLASPLRRVRHVAGATVLGAGQVVPVLNVADLMKSAQLMPLRQAGSPDDASEPAASLLVAEDSITSRLLLKGLLEAAGFRVATAADGVEAFEQLQEHDFDLLVSDVEMPRLDGLALTARVRGDKRLARLPVVLVTALESNEDRARGVEAGADAYIVKRGFDQRSLLDAIRRLL